jgi:hypothetical protein
MAICLRDYLRLQSCNFGVGEPPNDSHPLARCTEQRCFITLFCKLRLSHVNGHFDPLRCDVYQLCARGQYFPTFYSRPKLESVFEEVSQLEPVAGSRAATAKAGTVACWNSGWLN